MNSSAFSPMSTADAGRRGLGVALLCMFLNLVDGFDLLIISFVLPNLPTNSTDPSDPLNFASTAEKGYIVSFALVGMAVGAIGLARLADRYGRRLIALVGIAINCAGLVLSAVSPNAEFMMAARFITGVGIGMVSVAIVVAAQESAAPRYRNLATGLVMIGYPLGSVLAALSTNAITSAFGSNWKALFLLGAALAAAAFVAAYVGLPESVKAAEQRFESASGVDLATSEKAPSLVGKNLLMITLLLCVGYMTVSGVFNFAAGLTPDFVKTAITAGFDPNLANEALDAATSAARQTGQNVGLWLSLGCLAGAIALATLGLVVNAVRLTWVFCAIAVVAMLGFANAFPTPGHEPTVWLYAFAVALGVGIFGGISSYSALVPRAYPPLARAKGYGAMLGVGRLGAIIAPLISAYLVTEIGAQRLYNYTNLLLVVSLACAVGVVFVMRRQGSSRMAVLDPGHADQSNVNV
ncbi:MFS transporter [Gordonia sp. PKS22-38]|uniref:MFS transporter n=1 Tax=Gordonia prachuapensis TaxID=3115651 RepID=A0ABU7MV37_9ACTN|nr:MFS transporter [Gordonia sp. PKS22-38]